MKNLLYLLLFLSTQTFAQNKIVGYVKLQNSGKTPLENVEVYSLGASTVYTNNKGYFELTFANKKVGDLVAVIEFALDGYSVLNEEKCQGLVIPKDPTIAPLVVVMSNKSNFRQRKAEYYGVIINNATQNFEAERKKLQAQIDQLASNDDERRILLAEIAELEEAKQSIMERADALAEQFAEINVDAASQLAQDALALFKEGKIKEAIALMDDEVLDKNMKEAQQNKTTGEQLVMQADSAIQQGVENYMIKARIQKANLQWEEAFLSYKKAIVADSTNLSNLWEVGSYARDQHDKKFAIDCYERSLLYVKSISDEAMISNELGNQYLLNKNYIKAEQYLFKSLEIQENLVNENAEEAEINLSCVQENTGRYFAKTQQYEKAEKFYLGMRKK